MKEKITIGETEYEISAAWDPKRGIKVRIGIDNINWDKPPRLEAIVVDREFAPFKLEISSDKLDMKLIVRAENIDSTFVYYPQSSKSPIYREEVPAEWSDFKHEFYIER